MSDAQTATARARSTQVHLDAGDHIFVVRRPRAAAPEPDGAAELHAISAEPEPEPEPEPEQS